ncbi:MAG: hypothetical protein GQ570_07095 [Helicobacteraceae bacterium]|nr:hypothetical protein [Helicobacteraceae bacterium]
MNKVTLTLTSLVTFIALSGCSGHTLQDYADGYFNKKDQEPRAVTAKEVLKEEQTTQISTPLKVEAVDDTEEPRNVVVNAQAEPKEVEEYNARVNTTAVMSATAINNEKGYMQKNLDSWVEKKWVPFFSKEENKEAFEKEEQTPFTLQKYIDRWSEYNKAHPDDPNKTGLVGKMKTMPVIGEN